MNIIPIGEMHHRIGLEEPTRIDDGGGTAIETWSLVAEVWGALRPLRGEEDAQHDGQKSIKTFEVWLRYRPGVTSPMRLVIGGRVMHIKSAIDVNERRRFLKLLVEERLA